jgi:hypothetical protein
MVDRVHFSSDRSDWQTPDKIINAVIRIMGGIDLDPCSNAHGAEANVPALTHYTKRDNGLEWVWYGRVYMNPPYGKKGPDRIQPWAEKIDAEVEAGRVTKALSLVPARPGSEWWGIITRRASAILLIDGRLQFKGAPGGAPFPSALIAHGISAHRLARYTGHLGQVCTRKGTYLHEDEGEPDAL